MDIDFETLGIPEENREKLAGAFQAALDAEVDGLKRKNQELLGKVKAAGSLSEELESLRAYRENAEAVAKRQAEEQRGNYQKALEMAQREAEQKYKSAQDELAALRGQVEARDRAAALDSALDSVGVHPSLRAGARALFEGQVKIDDGRALIGESALDEYLGKWAQEDGRAYIAAPDNTGAGAQGPGPRNGKAANLRRSTMSAKEKAQFIAEHGQEKFFSIPYE